ncbi:MAG: dTDP-4-dehydrorhamnose 3,5-epimerase family protein [Candidatus Zixiibacteriota bacterium]
MKGVIIRELDVHLDSRGWLMELFRKDELARSNYPAMAYLSSTKPGVARGPHEHKKQTDLFCFLGLSQFKIFLWDNRRKSLTFKKKFIAECEKGRPTLVIVPPGVVHAYKNTGKSSGLVFNAPNRLFKGVKRRQPVDEIRHEENPNSPFKLND